MEHIKIENGKITTLISERQQGMTELLCTVTKNSDINKNSKVLIVSHNNNNAENTFWRFNSINPDTVFLPQYCSVKNFKNKLKGENYDIIIFDCPDINANNDDFFSLLVTAKNAKILIGITQENIAFNDNIRTKIKENFIDKSDYAYYLSLTRKYDFIGYDVKQYE